MSGVSRLIKHGDLVAQPWKNGAGITREVAIHPAGARLANLDFDWRISIAQVDSSGSFSKFPGYDRVLVVWKGPGLKINGAEKKPLEPFHFQGETPIMAGLMPDRVQDFGVIFRRGKIACDVTTRTLAEDSQADITAANGETFILCASGELRIEGFYLNPGDVYHAVSGVTTQVKALERSSIVVTHIEPS